MAIMRQNRLCYHGGMRANILILTALFIVTAGLFYWRSAHESQNSRPQAALNANVTLTDKGFEPDEVYVKAHGTVTFSSDRDRPFWPASNPHPTHELYPEFDPKAPVDPESSWTFTFDRVGDWGYHDHLRSYFTGVIHVVK